MKKFLVKQMGGGFHKTLSKHSPTSHFKLVEKLRNGDYRMRFFSSPFSGNRSSLSRKELGQFAIPKEMNFGDLADYVNALYYVFESSFQKFRETQKEEDAFIAIDALVTINRLEQMKNRLAQPVNS